MNNSKVKVAVRVRPLNQREKGLNSECVVRVNGNQITLLPSISCKEKDRKEPHIFTFDNCFWTEDRPETGQEDVFEHLGDGVLENIWLGYNVCIFAYGQTGSGKTFSMMGTNNQPGIVPRLCSALFNKEPNDAETIRIEASYLEIYNEEVRDLLKSAKKQNKLRVREGKPIGPYVEELSCHAVQSYEKIKLLLDQGNKQRAIAETKMNEQSSRSHAILTLTVTQTCNDRTSGAFKELVSKVSLVDLAGSERSNKSGAQGRQIKESCNINKSLLTLGLVINSLAESSENKKSQFVNYRDSVLTWLLKNNLGGNSKTIMLATVSPAADNYQETLSTLKYADSAKRIVNKAKVNEDVKSKAIEELQEEIKRLREALTTREQVQEQKSQLKETEVQELKSQLKEKENLLRDLETSWEEKLKRTEVATQEWQKNLENMGVTLNKQDVVFKNECYLTQRGIHLIIHHINYIIKIGSGPSQDIQISGPEAECEHCEITKTEEGEVFLIPVDNSKTYVNGSPCNTKTQLWHDDKIQLGTNVFILHLPKRPKPEHHATLPSDALSVQESRERLAVFFRDPNTDATWLLKLFSELSAFKYGTVCGCISHLGKDKWKSMVDKSSIIIVYHSHSSENPLPHLSDLKTFLDYCREKHGPENIKVVITDVEDIDSERKITEWWMVGRCWDWEPLTLSKAEMRSLTEHKINLLSAERRMANKLRHIYQIVHEAAKKKFNQEIEKQAFGNVTAWVMYKFGIFSRSTISDYSWITELLHSDNFKAHVSEVMPLDISNDPTNTTMCTFGILHFTKKKGQVNGIDAADCRLIQQYRTCLGKDNVIIVIDDVEDSSDQEKIQILESHPDKEELYHNLFLFSHQEKSSDYGTLLSSLLNINELQEQQVDDL